MAIGHEGTKVRLRPFEAADLDRTWQWRNDPALRDAILGHPYPVQRSVEAAWWASVGAGEPPSRIAWIVEELESREAVGIAQLARIDWIARSAHFGLLVGEPSRRGHGLGEEALRLLLDVGFRRLQLHKILCEVDAANGQALSLYRRAGFADEGLHREHCFQNGAWIDVAVLALFARDLRDPAPTGEKPAPRR